MKPVSGLVGTALWNCALELRFRTALLRFRTSDESDAAVKKLVVRVIGGDGDIEYFQLAYGAGGGTPGLIRTVMPGSTLNSSVSNSICPLPSRM